MSLKNGLHLFVFAWRDGVIGVEAYSREDAEAEAGGPYQTGLKLICCRSTDRELPVKARVAFFAHLQGEFGEGVGLRTSPETGIIRPSDD